MIYSLFFTLAFCVLFPFLLLSGKNRAKYLATFAQRVGGIDPEINPEKKPSIWVHAVSVGEALAAKSLVAELKATYPDHLILVSTTTSTGQKIAGEKLEAHGVFYFPFDWRFAVKRVLKAVNPKLCIVMETEIWPNFVKVLKKKNVPLVLANGRISDRSFQGYRKLSFFIKPILHRYHSLCAQSNSDAERLMELGARSCDTVVTGNLKYGEDQFRIEDGLVADLRKKLSLSDRNIVFIAGSTHETEEEAALEAFAKLLKERPDSRLILVPRKPERFDQVAEIIKARGFDFARYSEIQNSSTAQVILIDQIGLLLALYHLSHVAFIGGSLWNTGGHNLLEASVAGVPVLFGPTMHNFREVTKDVLAGNAGFQVQNKNELADQLCRLFSDVDLHQKMSEASVNVIQNNQEALPLTMKVVAEALTWSGKRTSPPAFLKALAWAHSRGASLIRYNPEAELQAANRLELPVISVGGLSFGGAGKTPMVSFLADLLISKGIATCLLTRGYKGKGENPFLVSDGRGNIADAASGGDEPVMLAKLHKKLIVVKDSDRFRGALYASEKCKPEIFLLDDGFQHRKLTRDLNILMLDADSLLSPRDESQLFREPYQFAGYADLIVLLSGTEQRREIASMKLQDDFPGVPLFHGNFVAVKISDMVSGKVISCEDIASEKLLALCGIAAPNRFLQTLNHSGITPELLKAYPDHHSYTRDDIAEILGLLKRSKSNAIITTEKDAQRLTAFNSTFPGEVKIYVLSGRLEIEEKDAFAQILADLNIL